MKKLKKNEIEKVLIKHDTSMIETIKSLEADQHKTKFVVSSDYTLLGSVSDGDIRRAIINGVELEENISLAMNCNPVCLALDEQSNVSNVFNKHSDILLLPILDEASRIVDVFTKLEKPSEKVPNTFFIMAGGLGMRLRPLTETIPKPMLQLGGKPILQRIIERAQNLGFHKILISTNYLAEQIEDYFEDGSSFGVSIDYIRESKRLGTAGSLYIAKPKLSSPSIVCNGDLLSDVAFDELLSFHKETNADATMATKRYVSQLPYGVVEHEGVTFKDIREKPMSCSSINIGVYCISKNILDDLNEEIPLDMPTLFKREKNRGKRVNVYPHIGQWLDIGTKEEYLAARNMYEK